MTADARTQANLEALSILLPAISMSALRYLRHTEMPLSCHLPLQPRPTPSPLNPQPSTLKPPAASALPDIATSATKGGKATARRRGRGVDRSLPISIALTLRKVDAIDKVGEDAQAVCCAGTAEVGIRQVGGLDDLVVGREHGFGDG